jgi:hypothetical protein
MLGKVSNFIKWHEPVHDMQECLAHLMTQKGHGKLCPVDTVRQSQWSRHLDTTFSSLASNMQFIPIATRVTCFACGEVRNPGEISDSHQKLMIRYMF